MRSSLVTLASRRTHAQPASGVCTGGGGSETARESPGTLFDFMFPLWRRVCAGRHFAIVPLHVRTGALPVTQAAPAHSLART